MFAMGMSISTGDIYHRRKYREDHYRRCDHTENPLIGDDEVEDTDHDREDVSEPYLERHRYRPA